jgi:hypothetical protein
MLEDYRVKKLSALEASKGPKAIFTGAVLNVHAEFLN